MRVERELLDPDGIPGPIVVPPRGVRAQVHLRARSPARAGRGDCRWRRGPPARAVPQAGGGDRSRGGGPDQIAIGGRYSLPFASARRQRCRRILQRTLCISYPRGSLYIRPPAACRRPPARVLFGEVLMETDVKDHPDEDHLQHDERGADGGSAQRARCGDRGRQEAVRSDAPDVHQRAAGDGRQDVRRREPDRHAVDPRALPERRARARQGGGRGGTVGGPRLGRTALA